MSVRRYLQKVGALPKVGKEETLMSVLTIVNDFFSPVTMVKPETLPWVAEALPDLEEHRRRSDLMLTCSSGDLRAAMPFLIKESAESLEDLIRELLNLRMYIHALSKGLTAVPSTDDYFVDTFNEMLGLTGSKRFSWKSQILDLYFSDNLLGAGRVLIDSYLRNSTPGEGDYVSILMSFLDYSQEKFVVLEEDSYILSPEPMDVLSGASVSEISLFKTDTDTSHICTLHWAPWPSAKTESEDPELLSMCEGFSVLGKDRWIKEISGQG